MPDTSVLNTTSSMPIEVKTYYDRLLLERALPNLPFLKYGQKKPIPKGNGKTIEFRKFNSLAPALTPLSDSLLIISISPSADESESFPFINARLVNSPLVARRAPEFSILFNIPRVIATPP